MRDEQTRFTPIAFPNQRPVHRRVHTDRIQSLNVDAAALASALRREVRGEVRFDSVSRALYSTDASVYEMYPLGVRSMVRWVRPSAGSSGNRLRYV